MIRFSFTTAGTAPVAGAPPAFAALIDWNNDGDFDDAIEDVTDRLVSVTWTRGRSSDFSGEAQGSATLVLRNDDDRFTPHVSVDLTASQLVPGRPVRLKATYLAVEYPQFFGYIERITYDPKGGTCTITTYDPLRRFEEVEAAIPANDYVQRTARDFRLALYDELTRGSPNLCLNPSFETNLTGWEYDNGLYGSITRVADAAPAVGGSWCMEWHSNGGFNWFAYRCRFLPTTFAGQTYRVSFWIKWVSGSSNVRADLVADPVFLGGYGSETKLKSKSVTVTNTWTRVSFTYVLTATTAANSPAALTLRIGMPDLAATPSTLRIDGVMITRGSEDVAYADAGVVGRWPNWCANGSFDGGALNGWYNGWTNLIANPSFESPAYGGTLSTTDWSATADAFHAASTSIDAAGVGGKTGNIGVQAYNGMHYAITGTFLAGHTYLVTSWQRPLGVGYLLSIGIGSNGTPTDYAETIITAGSNAWIMVTVQWKPTANRSDVHVFTAHANNNYSVIDAVSVTEMDGARLWADAGETVKVLPYCTQIGVASLSTTSKFGSKSQGVATGAVAGSGRLYDFHHSGAYFYAGQQYTASVWLRPSSSMAYRVGFMADKHDETWDTATATGTASANVWTQVTVTWTPSADRSSLNAFDTMLFIEQTDTTARTFLIDGVRVIPGSSADDFEPMTWELAIEPDAYTSAAQLNGSVLSGLSTINGLALSRHWTQPTDALPWYKYVTNSRDDFVAKVSSESYGEDISDLTVADIDRSSIVNRVAVTYSGGVEVYSDATSIAAYGVRPGSLGNGFLPDTTVPDAIGAMVLAMRKDPRSRPTLIVDNRFPSQLQREVAEVVTVTMNRRGIVAGRYNIQSFRTTVDLAGKRWHTEYALEEHPF